VKNWKRALKTNFVQMSFVFLAFALMVLVGCFSVGNVVQKGISSSVTVALDESEKTIRAYLREPKIAFDNIYMAVTGMLDRGESQEGIGAYLTQTTDSLRGQSEGVVGFNGVYGFIRDEFIDGIGLNPGEDFIPQQRPWYQLAIRNDLAEYTAPYTDAQTGRVIISLARKLYGANGDYYGVLALDVDITWMTEYVESLQFVRGGYGMIVNQYIYTVAHPLDMYSNIPLQELGDDYAEITDLLRKNHEVSAKRIRDTNGSNVIVYFRQLYNGWYMGVVMPVGGYYSDLYFTALALIVPGSILMLALNYILMRLSLAKMRSDEENKAKSSFLAHMSHEIRTPMNAILGMVELLLRKDLPREAREEAASIKHAANNLLGIINDILDFSKIEAGKMEIIAAEYQFASMINDVMTIIRVRLSDSPVKFVTNIGENIPGWLIGDEIRIRQILLNILSNAAKYTHKGQITFTVKAEIDGSGAVTLIAEVADTGIGIKAEDTDKLFGDFAQLDTHKNVGVEGTGLGLAITRSLCRAMGGDVTVKSIYGTGSVFTAIIPQQAEDLTPFSAVIGSGDEIREDGVRFIAPSARILIVDDIATNLKVAEGLLAPYRARIDTVLSGAQAIEFIRENEYDLIMMDHMMPGMDGIETATAIRAIPGIRFENIPIVALTANAFSGMREMFLQNGFHDYLAKPIEISKLNEIMEKWVPREKREKYVRKEQISAVSPEPEFFIDDVDTARGIAMTGGSARQYQEVLALYCDDAARRLEMLREPPGEDGLVSFTTQVHALKSASASIGAASLSKRAAELEMAGKKGDLSFIRENLSEFRGDLASLTKRVRAAIPSEPETAPGEESAVLSRESLLKLKAALEAERVGEADYMLEELANLPLARETKAILDAAAEHVLLSEWREASGAIAQLLESTYESESQP
jgi:signal transduction histidine kinase/DNA-binding response OmpR family regulator